jgi:hypothetical protein
MAASELRLRLPSGLSINSDYDDNDNSNIQCKVLLLLNLFSLLLLVKRRAVNSEPCSSVSALAELNTESGKITGTGCPYIHIYI